MIRYIGNLDFKEQPGTQGPTQAETGLDTLVRTFRGKTSDKYTFFNVTLNAPDRQFPQLFATNIEPIDLEGGLSDFRVTYKGMLSGTPQEPQIADSIVIKSGTVNAQYVYDRLESYDGQWLFQTFLGDAVPNLYPTWRERSVEIQANVSYYARATTYNYVRRNRPAGPQYQNLGVNGFNQPVEMFNTTPSGAVQVPRFPNITYAIAVSNTSSSDWIRFLNDLNTINDSPMRFKRIVITESTKKIICSNFTAERQGLWWVCSETWEVELAPLIVNPTPIN
jgi:hypothetical protein